MDLRVGDARVIVDHGVDECVTHQRVAVSVLLLAGRRGPVPLALLASDDPPAAAVGNVAELLHVDVDQCAGRLVLVMSGWLARLHLEMREPVQAAAQDRVDRRGRHPEPSGDPHRAEALLDPQMDDALHDRRRVPVRMRVGPARAIGHAVRAELDLPLRPLRRGRIRHPEVVRRRHAPSLVDDLAGEAKPLARVSAALA